MDGVDAFLVDVYADGGRAALADARFRSMYRLIPAAELAAWA